MKNLFALTGAEADALVTDFLARRDAAWAEDQPQVALTWQEAANAVTEAQMAAAHKRSKRRRKSLSTSH